MEFCPRLGVCGAMAERVPSFSIYFKVYRITKEFPKSFFYNPSHIGLFFLLLVFFINEEVGEMA